MHDERERVVAMLRTSGGAFLDLAESADDARWGLAPSWGGWSLAEVAEHVTLVETGVAKLIQRKLFAEPAPVELLVETRGKDERIDDYQADRTNRRTAPEFVTPRGMWPSRVELIAAFRDGRAAVVAGVEAAPGDLRVYAAIHPILGPLDAYQWALFLARHLERHLIQMEEILAELG
ncbi:MAG TPA: DinB family protein [Gemmatimonadales bacterium]